jgi:hypothetical protein
MPPVNHPERHFLMLVISPYALDDLRLLSRFAAPFLSSEYVESRLRPALIGLLYKLVLY